MRQIIENYQADALQSFRSYKKLAERAIEQVPHEEFFRAIDEEANSIGAIVKHIAGNMRSRWTDFLSPDGEKPDRNRDTEFELMQDTRESLMKHWEDGWKTLFDAIDSLTTEDFGKTVTIRGEPHTVVEAINRLVAARRFACGSRPLPGSCHSRNTSCGSVRDSGTR